MTQPADFAYTPCAIIAGRPTHKCQAPANVVLFARGGEFAGREYAPRERVLICLKHGGEIYDALRAQHTREHGKGRAWIGELAQTAYWIKPHLDNLPLVRLPDHNRPTTPTTRPRPWTPPTRVRSREGTPR